MPFTFSHPVIALPFTKTSYKRFSVTGFIIGSMIPDFEYFIRMKAVSTYSHSFSGIFWFDLPLCVIIALVFHGVVRESLIVHLPGFLKSRFLKYSRVNWFRYFKRYWPIVIISSLLGIFSHILWDSFTHINGYFVQILPFLRSTLSIFGIPFPVYNLMQHVSSLIGGFILFIFVIKMPKSNIPKEKLDFHYWGKICLTFICIISLRFAFGFDHKQYMDLIMVLISAGLLSFTITGGVMKWKKREVIS